MWGLKILILESLIQNILCKEWNSDYSTVLWAQIRWQVWYSERLKKKSCQIGWHQQCGLDLNSTLRQSTILWSSAWWVHQWRYVLYLILHAHTQLLCSRGSCHTSNSTVGRRTIIMDGVGILGHTSCRFVKWGPVGSPLKILTTYVGNIYKKEVVAAPKASVFSTSVPKFLMPGAHFSPGLKLVAHFTLIPEQVYRGIFFKTYNIF